MTPDDLKAALLLMGFERSPNQFGITGDIYRSILPGVWVMVRFNANPNNVGVRYLKSGDKYARRDFNSTPESVFNFIKKRLP